MQIRAVEVQNYAGFTSQVIPIRQGVQLLVGTNNAGKTALLQAVACLTTSEYTRYVPSDRISEFIFYHEPAGPTQLMPRRLTPNGPDLKVPGDLLRTKVQMHRSKLQSFVQSDLQIENGLLLPFLRQPANTFMQMFHAAYYGESGRPVYNTNISSNNMIADLLPPELKQALYISPNRSVLPEVQPGANRAIPLDGRYLASFFQTLTGDREDLLQDINAKFRECFPEFSSINIHYTGDTAISVYLRNRQTGENQDIKSCGSGVEQVLILLACLLGTLEPRLFLIDEPHNFLHPNLERRLIALFEETEHSIVVATHSAAMINAVPAAALTYVEKPGTSYDIHRASVANRGIALRQLGYHNSDLMLHDALIFVEGPSDTELLPTLLDKADWQFPDFFSVGLPDLGGTGDYTKFDDLQQDVIRQEKLILAFGKTNLPHLYLFDGDKAEFKARIEQTKPDGSVLEYAFLPVMELENYFLDAESITSAINCELSNRDVVARASKDQIEASLLHLTNLGSMKLQVAEFERYFPLGCSSGEELNAVKGSRVLKTLYKEYALTYDKRRSGRLLVDRLTLNERQKTEIVQFFSDVLKRLELSAQVEK